MMIVLLNILPAKTKSKYVKKDPPVFRKAK